MARKFLYLVAGAIALVLIAAIGWNLFQERILRAAFVPSTPFKAPLPAGAPDYAKAAGWLSRPDLRQDPSRWVPAGFSPATNPQVAVFYVAPTAYLGKGSWNAAIDDKETNDRLTLFTSSQASAFNGVAAIWAPRYRQAALGAFLTTGADPTAALDFAYRDVERAFDAFLAQIPPSRPIMLVGHSQGSLHLLRLIHEHVAGRAVQRRIVAAYLVGWPISVTADLPALGLPACGKAGQANCILSWQSFAEPADPKQILDVYDTTIGLAGKPRRGSVMLCVNPITGTPNTMAPAPANLGSLVPKAGLSDATIEPGRVPARCDARGFLSIGQPPEGYGGYVLPGNNYHVFDYPLFWANVRADAAARAATFLKQ